jgi:site-specific DNA-adenine methylase
VALIGGAAVFWYFKQRGARRNVYQAINTNDV